MFGGTAVVRRRRRPGGCSVASYRAVHVVCTCSSTRSVGKKYEIWSRRLELKKAGGEKKKRAESISLRGGLRRVTDKGDTRGVTGWDGQEHSSW